MRERISGIVPPMTTPFRSDDTIDEGALRAEARYLIETARVHGLARRGQHRRGPCPHHGGDPARHRRGE